LFQSFWSSLEFYTNFKNTNLANLGPM
jgi:hypothetical protein